MAEGEKVYQLLVYVIIALLLLFIFFTFFAPQYLWREEPAKIIKTKLGTAETDLGHYHSGETRFPEEFTVKAEGYESDSRSLIFECNSEVLCCPKGKDCDGTKAIEWNNDGEKRFFSFREEKPVVVSARCREEDIYICKVFIGEEPAQVNITAFEVSDTELDLAEKNWLKVKYKVENTGKQGIIAVHSIARLYKIKKLPYGLEPEKELVKEFSDKLFGLEAGAETESEIEIIIEGNGDYLLEFISFEETDETNYETESIEIQARGKVDIEKCIPKETESEYFSETECRYFFPCEDCKSLTECERKWRKQYNIPEEFKFELWEHDELGGTITFTAPGETREECKRECYPEFEIVKDISFSESPVDLMFVIDASGSMSDDIEEVKKVVETVYSKIGSECTTQASGEPCIKIGVYLLEGAFRECYITEQNPFFSNCLREEQGKRLFSYESYYYVECEKVQMYLALFHQKYCNPPEQENKIRCASIERDLQGTEKKSVLDFWPPNCRPVSTKFIAPGTGSLPGQTTDIGFIPITDKFETVTGALDEIIATQGYEAWADALYFVLSSDKIGWRENSEKAIILISDTYNNDILYNPYGGGATGLNEVARLAQEKKTRIFSLEAAGCDQLTGQLQNTLLNYMAQKYGLIEEKPQEMNCPGTDLQYISSQTGAISVNYKTADELPEKILSIITEEVKKTTGNFGLKVCGEGETPEYCSEKCVLPWEENCAGCSCAKYYQENLEDYSLLEILFVIDATGSMQEEIDSMKSSIAQVISAVEKECEKAGIEKCMRVSVRQVFGHPDSSDLLELTDNMDAVKNTIAGIFVGGGGDEKDPWAGEALLSLWNDNWQPQPKKIIFILTDTTNNPEEIVSEDYISMIKANEREGMDKAIVELGDFAQKNKFKIFGFFSESTENPKAQLDWLADKTDGKAIKFSEGENFSVAIGQLLLNEALEETDKQKCLDAQCETCTGLEVETSAVPLEWNYRFMCSHKTSECRLFLSCYSSPYNISLTECQRKWGERTGNQFEIKQETENNWLYIEGTKFKDGAETTGEEWNQCTLPKATSECGGETFEREEMPSGVDPYQNEWIDAGTGIQEPNPINPELVESEPIGELVPADKDELECLNELNCYCETGNENFEYLERIKESKKPIDLLVVLDATRSMYHEGTEFSEAFSELSDAMQEECLIDGNPCLRIGVLAFGGYPSNNKARLSFRKLDGAPATLENSLGSLYLGSEPGVMETAGGAVEGIGFQEEDEPWLDALAFASNQTNSDFIGWRENSQKAILLITSENDKVSVANGSTVAGKLAENHIQLYGAIKNLAVGSDNPVEQAGELNGKIFEYQTTTQDQSGRLWFENENKPFTDMLKMILKDSVEGEILNGQGKIICTEEECDSCVK